MESFQRYIVESMNVVIDNYDNYNNSMKSLDSLTNMLRDKLIIPTVNKMTEEQKDNIKQYVPLYDILVPDGNYYHNGEETINFYTAGLEEHKNKIIQGIKYFLDSSHIKYGPFKEEASNMFKSQVVRIPILHFNKAKNIAPEVNLSNRNAVWIFDQVLDFKHYRTEDGFHNIPVVDLYTKIEEIEKENVQFIKGTQSKNHYDLGLSQEQIIERLEQIKKIAKFALDNNYQTISVS